MQNLNTIKPVALDRKSKTPEVPKIRLTHPSTSDAKDETLEAEEAITRTTKEKYPTFPRQLKPKTPTRGAVPQSGMKKAASAAALHAKPGLRAMSAIKAPSASNLIMAAKLSANKAGGGTRKFTPFSPAKGAAAATAGNDQSSNFMSKLR